MLTLRTRRRAAATARALDRLAAIEASVIALADEDLLDLADILAAGAPTPLRDITAAEMRRRNISL
ncbi:hypothetical protein ACU5AX_14660 [Sphingomonas sp. XXL09]|uniref:hypothetical protein n=1 Tax=Sphingomonas sp. XXL09 TaxID=3457787 RepID=UPI00406BD550